ncbi:serine/threonine-protein kinase PAK 3-like [Cyanocitta cristata]
MLEEELKRIQEKLNLLRQALQKQVEVLTSQLAACKDFQRVIGHKEPQGWHGAQELSQPDLLQLEPVLQMVEEKRTPWEEICTGSRMEPAPAAAAAALSKGAFAPQPEKRSPGSLLSSNTDTASSHQQEMEDDLLELLRKMVSMENPVTKYTELENIGRGGFGEVCRAFDNATGGEVAIKKINLQGLRRKEVTVNELMVMKMNRNPNLVNYLDSYLVDEEVWLVMEYMDGGTLSDAIRKTYLSEDEMAAVSREVRDPTCASKGLGRIVWETGAENWRDSMCQTLLLCGCYAMGKQVNCVAVCLHSLACKDWIFFTQTMSSIEM